MELNVSDSAQRGDTFTISLDKNLLPSQVMPLSPENSPGYTWNPPTLNDQSGYTIATGVYNQYTNSIVYTFTDYVDKKDNITARLSLGNIGTNKENIRTNGVYSFTNYVDGIAQSATKFNVDYGKPSAPDNLPDMDGKNAITEINPQKKVLRYIAYINPEGNGPNFDTNILLRENAVYPNYNLDMRNANVKFYKVPESKRSDQNLMPDSMMPNMSLLEQYRDNNVRINDTITNGKYAYIGYNSSTIPYNKLNNAYVIIADIPYKDSADKINLGFKWTAQTIPDAWVSHNAFIGIRGNSGGGSGDEIIPLPKEASLTIVNKPTEQPQNTGSFTIDKTDNNNKPLDGAVFELESRDNQNYKITLNQSVNGKFEVNNIPQGSYILREIAAPENYKKTDKEWNVFVNSKGQVFIEELGNFTPTPGVGGQDITSRVQLNSESSIGFNDANNNGTLDMDSGENNITINMDMFISGRVNPGDYFTIKESDTLHYNMLQPDALNYNDILTEDGSAVLANVVFGEGFNTYDGSNKTVHYVFTDAVSSMNDITMNLKIDRSVNINYAPNNQSYNFGVTIGSNNLNKDITLKYDDPAQRGLPNVAANYLYTNDTTGLYTQIAYINPKGENITGESKITVSPSPTDNNMADIGAEKTKFTLYKLKPGASLTNSVIFEPEKWEIVPATNYSVYFKTKDSGEKVDLYMDDGRYTFSLNAAEITLNNIGTDTYLIKIDSAMAKTDTTDNLRQLVQLENNGVGVWKENNFSTHTGGGTGTGESDYIPPTLQVINEPADKGRFEIDKVGKDGEKEEPLKGAEFTLTDSSGETVIRTSDENGKVIFDNLEPGTYTLVESKTPDGYKDSEKTWTVEVDKNGVTTVHETTTETTNSRFESAFNSLGLSDNPVFQNLMALPTGTTDKDISIIQSVGKVGNATVNTNAEYLGNNEFQVKLDVAAGVDQKGTDVKKKDIMVLIPIDQSNRDNGIEAYITALKEFFEPLKGNDAYRVSLITYYSDIVYRTTDNKNLGIPLQSVDGFLNNLNTITFLNGSSNYLGIAAAFKEAKALLAADRTEPRADADKIIIHASSSIPNLGTIRDAIKGTNKGNNKLSIYNFQLVNNSVYLNNYKKAFEDSGIVDSYTNVQILSKNSNDYKSYLPDLPATNDIKAVENAKFEVTFNSNFEFVGGSTLTSKANPSSGQWHSSYSGGTIGLRNGELTLNANQTATMTFKVKAIGDLKAGETYPLINKIAFKPNSTTEEKSIDAPQVKIAESTFTLHVKSSHTGNIQNGAYGQFDLFRTGSDGKPEKVNFYKFDLNKGIEIPNLRLKDSSGQDYKYTVDHIWFSDPDIHFLGTSEGIEQNTITIRSEYRPGFKIDVDWGPLQPIGKLTIGLAKQGASELSDLTTIVLPNDDGSYYYYNPEITDNYPVVVSVDGEEGYIHSIRQNSESSWSIVVRKKDSPAIKVVNEKQSTKLTILKVDENDATKVLPGAVFTLVSVDESTYVESVTTGADGKATFYNLTTGMYTLKETQAPEGYEISDNTWTVVVDAKGQVTVKEPDTTNNVKNETVTNSATANFTSNYNGYSVSDASIWYELAKTNTFGDYNLTVHFIPKNQYQNSYRQLALYFDTNNFEVNYNGYRQMEPVGFNFYSGNQNGAQDRTFYIRVKDSTGTKTLYPLLSYSWGGGEVNNYAYLPRIDLVNKTETTTGTTIPFNDPETNEITVTNPKIPTQNFKVKKTNEDGSQVLEGAEFTLKKADSNWQELEGENPIVQTTGVDGYATFNDLPLGNYLLTETKAPVGYEKWSDYTWRIKVEENKVSVVNDREYNVSYQIANPGKTKRLYYWYGGRQYNLIDFTTSMRAIANTNSYYLDISYTGLESGYGSRYDLSIEFDTDNFIVDKAPNGYGLWTVRSGQYYRANNGYDYKNSDTITYIVTPKDPVPYGPNISPIKSLSYANRYFGVIEPSYYAGLKNVTELNTNPLDLNKVGDAFEYSIINKGILGSVEFQKVEKIETDGNISYKGLPQAVFEVEKKNSDGTYTKLNRVYISDADGKLVVDGLEVGEYRLIEKAPPTGYRPQLGFSKEFKILVNENNETYALVKDQNGNYVANNDNLKRIENIKLGEYEYSFIKRDASTGDPIDGVVFEIRNADGVPVGVQRTSGVLSKPGEDPVAGKVTFTELTPGKYWIYEITQKDGYIKESKPIAILVGEQYDVPKDESGQPIQGRDLSEFFRLDPAKPSTLTSTSKNEEVVYPNVAEGLEANLNYLIDESVQVKPGDRFTIKLSDNVDLFGLNDKTEDGNRAADIYGPMGRIAVASIRDNRRTIDYTFTEAIQPNDKITSLSISTPMFIDRYVTPYNKDDLPITIKVGDGNNAVFSDTIDINYDDPNGYGYINDRTNIKTYVTRFEPTNGEFTAVTYINPWRTVDSRRDVYFGTNIPSTITSVNIYSTTANSPLLPWSFAIDYSDLSNPYKLDWKVRNNTPTKVDMDNPLHYYLPDYFGSDYGRQQYVMVVKGKVSKEGEFKTITGYDRNSNYIQGVNGNWRRGFDEWSTYIEYYAPSGETNAERSMYNQKNKIEYTKMSGKLVAYVPEPETGGDTDVETPTEGQPTPPKTVYAQVPESPLKGAKFQLLKKNGDNWEDYENIKTSGEDGKFFWEGLPQGEYQVKETMAPEGHKLPKDQIVSSFTVNENGEIVNIKNNTTIIINEKDEMYFKLQKIWKKSEGNGLVDTPINIGTLELKLQAPKTDAFKNTVKEEAIQDGKYYGIKEVSTNKDYIILEVDLKAAADVGVHEDGIQIDVPSDWPSGDYILTETKAPAGFIKTDDEFKITINQEENTIKYGETTLYSKIEETETLGILKIENKPGVFPSTGGRGTLIYTIVGTLTMALALVQYRRKKVIG